MSSGIVRATLCSIITDSTFIHCKPAQDQTSAFLRVITDKEICVSAFEEFSTNLMHSLERCLLDCITREANFRSFNVMRENIWSCFHKLRLGDISKMWKDFCKSNGVTLSPLVYQHINQKLYSDLIKSRFSKKPSESTVDIPELTTDEENVIRYIAGYVPFKLLKRYEQSVCEESEEFIECRQRRPKTNDNKGCCR